MEQIGLGLARTALVAAAALAVAAGGVQAQDYSGRTLKIVIPYGPGGTYDKYGATFADHLGKFIPGQPNIILQHMPGAGGAKAMNWAYNAMPKDGFNMIVPLDNSVVNQLMRPKKMRYDARNYTWIGSSNQTNIVMVVRTDTGVKSWKDMQTIPIIASTSGKNSIGYIIPKLAAELLGLKIKIVTGYKGSSRSILAMEQGESSSASFNWLAWSSKVPQWFTGDKPFAKPVLQVGIFRDPDLPADVPMLGDLVSDPMDKAVVRFIAVAGLLGRGLALPPGVPKSAVATLRAAYDKMNADSAFATTLEKRRLRLMASSGARIQDVVNQALAEASPAVVARASKLVFGR
jgi:tripartite-type tricarboxylate transporter receptor subunit TctC